MHASVLSAVPLLPKVALAEPTIDLGLPGGDGLRSLTTTFPGKG